MEPIKPQPSGVPDRSSPAVPQPLRPRPLMNDFGPRRPAPPLSSSPRPHTPVAPAQAAPVQASSSGSLLRPLSSTAPQPEVSLAETSAASTSEATDTPLPQNQAERTDPQTPKGPHPTRHAGLIGFTLFVVLAAVLLSPFVPGKTLDNFPGNSQSFSSGDQALACLTPLTNISASQVYDSRLGAPITYQYSTTTTQTGSCNGTPQSAITGHSAQFNPLGLLIDLTAALVVGVIVAKIWKKIFGVKHTR